MLLKSLKWKVNVRVVKENFRKEQVSYTFSFGKAVQCCGSLLVIEPDVRKGVFCKREIAIKEIACSLIPAISE